MVEQASITDMVMPDVDTIRPSDPVRVAQRRMESQNRRSLIVVDADRPVGVVQWRDIMDEDDPSVPVEDRMVREFPVLRAGMSVQDARANLGQVDVDRLPVVDDDGHLVGEVPRERLVHRQEVVDTGASEGATDQAFAPGTAPDLSAQAEAPPVAAGMSVKGSSGKKLGTIAQVVVDQAGRLSAVTVEHGWLSKKHKRIPVEVIQRVEDGEAYLAIDSAEFKMLADLET